MDIINLDIGYDKPGEIEELRISVIITKDAAAHDDVALRLIRSSKAWYWRRNFAATRVNLNIIII